MDASGSDLRKTPNPNSTLSSVTAILSLRKLPMTTTSAASATAIVG